MPVPRDGPFASLAALTSLHTCIIDEVHFKRGRESQIISPQTKLPTSLEMNPTHLLMSFHFECFITLHRLEIGRGPE